MRAAAVSDFTGRGTMRAADYDSSDHARYLVEDSRGDIDVIRVDDVGIPPGGAVVMKVDVEGAEDAAVRGAERTLGEASEFAVSFEAHPLVSERTGVDPIETIRRLNALRPCRVRVSEFPKARISTERSFFGQVPDDDMRGLTILCRSAPPGPLRSA